MISSAEIRLRDKSDMYSVIRDFPLQLEEAFNIGKNTDVPYDLSGINKIIFTGMGGSAIGGDIIRSYCVKEMTIPFIVNRNYTLPSYAEGNTLLVVSSYSGDTEETIAAYEEGKSRGCKILTITSGGKLSVLSENDGFYSIKIPKGYQPRCALGFSFLPFMMFLRNKGLINFNDSVIEEFINYLKLKSSSFSDYENADNLAVSIARHLYGKIPVIYSSSDMLDAVNLRWRSQFAENSKVLAFGNLLPEMNHNEICGWENNKEILRNFAVIMLRDTDDHPRNRYRMKITSEIIEPYRGVMIELESEGRNRLERMFDLIYLGDWVSYYLAILYKSDPSEIENINILKRKLTEI
ncbi:MAG: bifunctional phosphoglucose/phosphomannose isomerase [Ignavibacteria bacterium]|nr:bifunctional phosphoglucose/phosphomannose isomerase [Ignavibacteria bacterium]